MAKWIPLTSYAKIVGLTYSVCNDYYQMFLGVDISIHNHVTAKTTQMTDENGKPFYTEVPALDIVAAYALAAFIKDTDNTLTSKLSKAMIL